MRAARFHEFGAPEVLQIDDIPVPNAGPNQVVVKVAATSFNPADAAIRNGDFTKMTGLEIPLPATPGLDVSGQITETGEGVEGFKVGDAVVGYLPVTGPGAAAEYVVAPANILTFAPHSIPREDAAVLPAVGLTAWQAVFEHGHLHAGERVLVVGGGSAVGSYVVQLAVGAGATVVATAGPDSLDRVRSYGAEQVLDRTAGPLVPSDLGEFDLTINTAPVPFEELLALTRAGGRIVSTTTPVDADNARGVTAVRMASRSDSEQLARLVAEVDAGRVRVWVGDRRTIAEIAQVHAEYHGKTILTPA